MTGLMRVACTGLLLCIGMTAQAGISVDTQVDTVEVYSSGASITRSGQSSVPAGREVLEFHGLPSGLRLDQLQITLEGQGLQMGQVRLNSIPTTQAYAEDVRKLESDIVLVKQAIRGIDDAISTANLQLQFLQGLAQGYAKDAWFEGVQGSADVNSWRGALTMLGQSANDARKVIRDNEAARLG